jgi:hypothetical protein
MSESRDPSDDETVQDETLELDEKFEPDEKKVEDMTLGEAYAAAGKEWLESEDAALWDSALADGLEPEDWPEDWKGKP